MVNCCFTCDKPHVLMDCIKNIWGGLKKWVGIITFLLTEGKVDGYIEVLRLKHCVGYMTTKKTIQLTLYISKNVRSNRYLSLKCGI